MRVLVLDDYQRVAAECTDWSRLGDDVDVTFSHEHLSGDDLVTTASGAEVIVGMRERTPFDAATLARLPDLRLLITTGPGNASFDLAAAREQDVVVCATGHLLSPAAELTWALILAVMRHVPAEDADVRAGGWQLSVGEELEGRTLGVIGLGRLGQRVARVGLAFEMPVLAWSQNLDPEVARGLGVEPVDKERLLRESDVVTLHLRLSERTRGIVGAADLAVMKRSAYLVNTSRGPLVDEAALVAALADGSIAGAGLDVFDVEPLPADHPLRRAPNAVLTPHIGYVTRNGYRLYFDGIVEDILAWRAGDPVRVLT